MSGLIVGHFTRIYATWSGVLLPADCQALDQEASQTINGDDGGTWAPFEQIEFSGATNGLEVLGPVVVFQGPNSGTPGSLGFLATQGPGAPLFKYVGPGFPKLVNGHAGQTRTLPTLLGSAVATPTYGASPAVVNGACNGGLQTGACAYAQEAGGVTQITQGAVTQTNLEMWQELRVHHGATLSQVVVNFAVGVPHAAVPTLPKARVLRVDVNGNTTPLTSTASGADGAGYVSPAAPSSGAAWYNLGAAQSWTIPCDQNNVVDITQYYYVIDIVEEQTGTVVPVLAPVAAASTVSNFAANGAGGIIDTLATVAGERYLLAAQANPRQNGPWICQTGDWTRPDDWLLGSSGAPLTQVYVTPAAGTANGGKWFALQGAAAVTVGGYPAWKPAHAYTVGQIVVPTAEVGWAYVCIVAGTSAGTDPTASWPTGQGSQVTDGTGTPVPLTWEAFKDPGSPAAFAAPTPLGNIWLSAVGTFTNITSLAFQ